MTKNHGKEDKHKPVKRHPQNSQKQHHLSQLN